jgi:hypothetical protein
MEVGIRFLGRQSELLVADIEAELACVGIERHKGDPKGLTVIRVRRGFLPAGEDSGKGKRLRSHGHGRHDQHQEAYEWGEQGSLRPPGRCHTSSGLEELVHVSLLSSCS